MFIINNKILILIIFILIWYIFKNKYIECMTDDSSLDEKIINKINKIYNADISSIRNLGEIADKLQRN
jgi:hypothetical protein